MHSPGDPEDQSGLSWRLVWVRNRIWGLQKHLTALAFPLCWISRVCKSFHIKQEVEKHLGESPCLEKPSGGSS